MGANSMSRRLMVGAVLAAVLSSPAMAWAQGANAWATVYIGGHAGMQWDRVEYVEPDDPSLAISPRLSGFAGGVLAGYNIRTRPFMVGVEGDTGAVSASVGPNIEADGNDYTKFEMGWSGHARARAGWFKGRSLFFVAGGLAFARITVDDTDPDFGVGTKTHTGPSFGGGMERAVGDRLFVRVEYLADWLGTKTYDIAAPPGKYFPLYKAETKWTAHTLRAAVAFRF